MFKISFYRINVMKADKIFWFSSVQSKMKEIHPKKSLSLLTLIFRSINLNEEEMNDFHYCSDIRSEWFHTADDNERERPGLVEQMASVQAPKEQAAAHPAQWLISQVNVPSLDATLESARIAPPKGYMIS